VSLPDGFAFAHELRVRWGETDPQGIVFNANYLLYADVAFTEYVRALGYPYPMPTKDAGTELFAVRSEVDFRGPARFDDMIAVAVRTARIGRSSFTMEFEIRRGDDLLTAIRTTYVNAAPDGGGAKAVPADFVARLDAFEVVAPARG
jgi:acyl-CoA thioester hydrolase